MLQNEVMSKFQSAAEHIKVLKGSEKKKRQKVLMDDLKIISKSFPACVEQQQVSGSFCIT